MESIVGPNGSIKIPVFHTAGLGNLNALNRDRWFGRLVPDLIENRQGCFLDVGANRGQTLINAATFIPDRKYVAFEPNISCCYYLQRLISANKFQNVTVIPCGIATAVEVMQLFINNDFDDSGTFYPESRGEESFSFKKTALVLNGDELVRKLDLSGIGVIKIDVEGAEFKVLNGLAVTIDQFSPPIIFESLPFASLDDEYYAQFAMKVSKVAQRKAIKYRESLAVNVQKFLCEHNYRIAKIEQQNGWITPIDNLSDPDNKDMVNINYLAIHETQWGGYQHLIRT